MGKHNPKQCICIVATLFLLLFNHMGSTQVTAELEEITVHSTRIEESILNVPAAISYVGKDDIQPGRQQLGLDESLVRVPGLFMQNRYNFSQDLRIAIRGFGARAAFGIRGVRVFVDGIPATLPDGQSGVDSIDLGSTDNIEVIRGPASSLYGTASGGVISITTEDGPETPFVEGRLSAGEYDFQKYQLKTGGQAGNLDYLMNLSHTRVDGYRQQSKMENTLFNSRFQYDFTEKDRLRAIINIVDSPIAQDPGALTAAQMASDPTAARDRNIQFDGGEAIEQQQLGFVYERELNPGHEISLRNYYVWRDFSNRLPFGFGGIVEFDRFFMGGGGQYSWTGDLAGHGNHFIAGFTIESQEDNRQRYVNNNGIQGAQTLNQIENVDTTGLFLQDRLDINEQLSLNLGLRYDQIDFDVEDRFLSNGNDSGTIGFDELSPSAGLLYAWSDQTHFYARIATSFETPTTTEFANPSGAGGFNPDLKPQTATSYELGVKGSLLENVQYDLTVFTMDVEDELVAFELAAFPGRDFFRNAGESSREGIELSMTAQLMEGLTASMAYTYSDFEFVRYTTPSGTFDGNDIPGIPQHQFFAELAYKHENGMYVTWDIQHVDELFANDSNTVTSDRYIVSNLRAGMEKRIGNTLVSPFIGINNLFGERYTSNVRLNAFGSRYFEPAPELNVFGGLSVHFDY